MERVLEYRIRKIQKEEVRESFYRLFWIYVICGVAGFFIESIWCWIDFREFTSRTSDLFFPISCVWGLGGVLLHLLNVNNRWNHPAWIFVKCTAAGAALLRMHERQQQKPAENHIEYILDRCFTDQTLQ